MNLHAIVPDNTQLLVDYLTHRFGYRFHAVPGGSGDIEYSTFGGSTTVDTLRARDALIYLNDALLWQSEERALAR